MANGDIKVHRYRCLGCFFKVADGKVKPKSEKKGGKK
jgi:hypothetical protein